MNQAFWDACYEYYLQRTRYYTTGEKFIKFITSLRFLVGLLCGIIISGCIVQRL
ncbi:hypothetical protein BDZ45DRAFT_40024 [Acephala macrosclerotiorum]|nr:hypothetical protein BDZ45DRAFT_40024 [Acephala macrosclerotiorum]